MTFQDSQIYRLLRLARYTPKNIHAKVRAVLSKEPISDFNSYERRYHSQNGEDGIIWIIFERIRTTNKFAVEFGIEKNEGNTIWLKKKGWNCLWMDAGGDGKAIKREFITAENVQGLFRGYGVPREFDLLSIDIDLNDYWVWKAITYYHPRVVVIEYNSTIPPTESKTVSYDPAASWDHTNYMGASLLALKKLGEEKGYTLLAGDSMGVNAFFVRDDLILNRFVVRPIEEIYRPPKYLGGKGHHPSDKKMIEV